MSVKSHSTMNCISPLFQDNETGFHWLLMTSQTSLRRERDVTNRLASVPVALSIFSSAFNPEKGIDRKKSGSNFKLRYRDYRLIKEITHSNRICITNRIYFNQVTRELRTLKCRKKNCLLPRSS